MNIFALAVSFLAYLAFLIFIGFALYTWFFRRKFTRERFAFFALTSCVAVTIATVASISGKAALWEQVLILYHYHHTGEILNPSLEPRLSALLVVLTFGLYFLAYFLFQTWEGQVSKETYNALQTEDGRSVERLIKESTVELRRLLNGQPNIPFYKPPVSEPQLPDLSILRDSIPWHKFSRNLLKMRRNALEFRGWHTEHSFWTAYHKDHGHTVAIKCSVRIPETNQLEAFIDYVSLMQDVPDKFILVIQSDSDEITQIKIRESEVEIISQEQLLNNLVDFSEYREKIRQRVTVEKLRDSSLTLDLTYVKPRYSSSSRQAANTESDIEDAINSWLSEDSNKQLAVLGEYGQGKSTMALMLTHHLLEQGIENIRRIPILIELRGKSPSTMTPGELLSTWAHLYGANSRHLEALHEAGHLLIIFDGFDEMSLVGSPQERLRHFQTLWSFNHPKSKLILTGRPNLFLDNNELKAALGIKESSSGKLACEAWYLEKFNIAEIKQALRNSPKDIREGIVHAVKSNPRLRDIASRPSLLHVISILWNDEISSRASELTSAEIMGRFLKASLERQTEKALGLRRHEINIQKSTTPGKEIPPGYRSSPRNYMVINAAERYFFMLGISVHMMQKDETNQININELDEIIEKLAKVCPASISLTTDAIMNEANQPIGTRIEQSEDFLLRLQDDVRTCGLLVNDSIDRAFKFSHKSFMEYMVSDYAERHHAKSNDDDIDAIKSITNSSFDDVLVNSVTRGYFGELFIWRRAKEKISQNNLSLIALFLLDQIVRPNWLQKSKWILGVKTLSFAKRKSALSALTQPIRLPLITTARYLLMRFDASTYEKNRYLYKKNEVFFNLTLITSLSFLVSIPALSILSSHSVLIQEDIVSIQSLNEGSPDYFLSMATVDLLQN